MSARAPKTEGPPPQTQNQPSTCDAGPVRSDIHEVCQNRLITNLATKEAAIVALRVGAEAVFASMHPPLLECVDGLDNTIDRIFTRRECRALGLEYDGMFPVEYSVCSPLKSSGRHKIGIALDTLLDAAESAGVDRNAMRDAVYAPVIAADDKERARRRRRAEANERVVTAWNTAIVEAAAIGASPRATLAAAASAVRRSQSGRPAEKGGRRD